MQDACATVLGQSQQFTILQLLTGVEQQQYLGFGRAGGGCQAGRAAIGQLAPLYLGLLRRVLPELPGNRRQTQGEDKHQQ